MIAANSSTLLRAGLRVRPAVADDEEQLSSLIFFGARVHRHLDWRPPLEWLGSSPFWVLEWDGRLAAVLACPEDPPSIAWLRLFAHARSLSGAEAWPPLWAAARAELAGRGGATAAAILTQPWLQPLLKESGFQLNTEIILLEWHGGRPADRPAPGGVSIRPMQTADLPEVTAIDSAAFAPLWQNSLEALRRAHSQGLFMTVAWDETGLIGYQLSTGNQLGVHLARLAVRPEVQGRGLGYALVHDLILRMKERRLERLTVNTQADNAASLSLYQRMGFQRSGELYPVYTHQAEAP
jgi:ribosomal-protein-alanine N-acetyltransferase